MAGGQQFQSKPKLTDAFGFISNSERKAQSRLAYRSAYGLTKDGRGSGWMKHGVCPPIKATYKGGK